MSRFFSRLVVRFAMRLAAVLGYQPKPLRLPEQERHPAATTAGHVCQDENATVVNGRWVCNCPRPLARRCSIDPECLLPDGHRGDCDPEEYT